MSLFTTSDTMQGSPAHCASMSTKGCPSKVEGMRKQSIACSSWLTSDRSPKKITFSAIPNIMFGNRTLFFLGLGYQIIVFAICMFFALRLFMSDKIFTISLNFGQKTKYKIKKRKAVKENKTNS